MRKISDKVRLAIIMGIMTAAAAVSAGWEASRARAGQTAGVELFEAADGSSWLFLPSWADRGLEAAQYDGQNVTVMQSENIPSVFIETESGTLEHLRADKEETERGKITVTLPDGSVHYMGALEEMRGRGNTTWVPDKKPFQIKLKEAADLLGMGEGKTWILLASAYDETGLRNTIALDLAREAGLAYTPQSVPVNLYCNGEYQGSYLLCEKVQVRKSRVDIGNGFLIERELQERYEKEFYLEGKSGFQTEQGEYYLVEAPERPTQKQLAFIRSLVEEAEAAAAAPDGVHPETGKRWSDYLDKTSFVRKYLLEEVTKNYDGGVTSAFYYVPEGEDKLYAGPAWDYDLIFGNNTLDEMNSNPEGITELADHTFSPQLYSALMEQEDFRQAVSDCFETDYLPHLEALLDGGIEELAGVTAASMEMDHIRWAEMENRYQYYESYENNLRYLHFFIQKRTDFLKEVWLDGEVYRTVTLQVNGEKWRKLYVKDGGLLGELPVPFLNDRIFVGWYRDDQKKYDPYRPVYEDMILDAVWQEIGAGR